MLQDLSFKESSLSDLYKREFEKHIFNVFISCYYMWVLGFFWPTDYIRKKKGKPDISGDLKFYAFEMKWKWLGNYGKIVLLKKNPTPSFIAKTELSLDFLRKGKFCIMAQLK